MRRDTEPGNALGRSPSSRFRRARVARLLVLTALPCLLLFRGSAPAAASGPDWFAMSGAEFRKRQEVRRKIDINAIDERLLAAAIFHETNLRRERHRLPVLGYDVQAEAAARMQAEAMAKGKFVGHTNPLDPKRRELANRVLLAGMRPAFAGENVARTFARDYKSGAEFTVEEQKGGELVFRYAKNGKVIQMHTYLSFAVALLDGWMNSPSHRKNILHARPRLMGCSGIPGRDATGIEIFYCVQVFYAPMGMK